jgi:predicted DNA-binding transcriptional regulator YafY
MSGESAATKVARLLALTPWIAAHPDGASMADICDRFDISPRQLKSDLMVLNLVGVAPRSPGDFVDVVIDGDRVSIRPQWFDRPPALTAAQGLALLAAADGLQDVQGADPDGPLARALAKVQESIGMEVGRDVDVDLGSADHEVMAQVSQAVLGQTQLAVSYYSHGTDRVTDRSIEPWRLFSSDGFWYVDAWCLDANALRKFRLDRFVAVASNGAKATVVRPEISEPGNRSYNPGENDVEVTLVIDAEVAWVVDRWNASSVTNLPDGRVQVELSVGSLAWLERLLVQLGARVSVTAISDPDVIDRAAVARRILQRYRS